MSQTLKLALFGDPVEHSLSPEIHRRFGQQTGIALDYRAVRCRGEDFGPRFAAFIVAGGRGANLTVPLKQAGLGVCQQVAAAARTARAVNTLVRREDGWHGDNTDGSGLMLDLQRLGLDPAGKRVLMIGAGGAAAGVLGPLLDRQPALTVILNRTRERAEALAQKFAHRGVVIGGGFDQAGDLNGFDLLIQATSSGHGQALPPLERGWLDARAVAYDLNYGPAHRPFADWCSRQSLVCHDGLGMLVGQAALAFEIWTGRRPQMDPVLAALRSGQTAP
ncbi:shikimate dehydrogenase [Wenzhouxiangella limi]|uniref:Shikimate dehydrogenase (NADP(+)) n=1 Tax=Wenzhouxiangella limi TaxID=2707351 RepID=A0A845V7K8_9GAMM|nr:shikimate dehydrogenase [Wenzhouxiangella limi]NDY95915.1 shikimate dehydrogenase [Wenzhouxiangella limi]